MAKKIKEEDKVSLKEYLAATQELEELRKANGMDPYKEGKISRFISWIFNLGSDRQLHTVNKKLYILFCCLFGWLGAHRFYEKRWILGVIYLAFGVIWFPNLIGFPLAMSIIDLLIVIPKQKDEEGNIQL